MNSDFDTLAHIDCDCRDEETCKLFWHLDNFNDYEPEDEPEPYEQYETQLDVAAAGGNAEKPINEWKSG